MDGLILGKDVWNLIIEQLDSQADRAACSETCYMFWMLVKNGTKKFVCKPNAKFCFKITKLLFSLGRSIKIKYPSHVVVLDVGVFPLDMVQERVFESSIVPKPFRLKTLKWKTFSFNENLEIIGVCKGIDADFNHLYSMCGKRFVGTDDELVIGSMGWDINCYCYIRLLPP